MFTAQDWDAFSGLDRTLIAVLLSIATLQEAGPDGPKEPTQIRDLTDDLTRIQALVHQSNSKADASNGPIFPRDSEAVAAGSLDWGSQHRWASCGTMPPRVIPEVETNDEGELGSFSSGDSVDQEAVARDAAALAEGWRPPRSPKKSIFPVSTTSRQLFGSSPLSSPDHSSLPSSPAGPRQASSAASRASSAAAPNPVAGPSRSAALPPIPEGEVPESDDQQEKRACSIIVICDSILTISLARKRKRSSKKAKKAEKAKRSRVDKSSDTEQAEGPARVTRSSRRNTPAAS